MLPDAASRRNYHIKPLQLRQGRQPLCQQIAPIRSFL
jgi:hypothetical protein